LLWSSHPMVVRPVEESTCLPREVKMNSGYVLLVPVGNLNYVKAIYR